MQLNLATPALSSPQTIGGTQHRQRAMKRKVLVSGNECVRNGGEHFEMREVCGEIFYFGEKLMDVEIGMFLTHFVQDEVFMMCNSDNYNIKACRLH